MIPHHRRLHVAVCIPTYCRPEGLRRCLQSIARQRFDHVPAPDMRVYVVDNHTAGEGRAVCEHMATVYPYPLHVTIEPKQGLSHARNALFSALPDETELIALIDDDERASPGWLDHLIKTLVVSDAHVVNGPVVAVYEKQAPEWFLLSGISHQGDIKKGATGERSPSFKTNNALIDARVLRAVGKPWFPPELALAGSEDKAFFRKVKDTGFDRFVWCSEAIVEEDVPEHRTTWRFFVRRCFQRGQSEVMFERLFWTKTIHGFQSMGKTLGILSVGLAASIVLLPIRAYRYRAFRFFLYGVGRLQAHLGVDSLFYKEPTPG